MDNHGNEITFSYNTNNRGFVSDNNRAKAQLQSLRPAGSNQNVVFSYHTSGYSKGKLDYITFDGDKWDYNYDSNTYNVGTTGDINSGSFTVITKVVTTLKEVIRPDSRKWEFAYNPIPVYWNTEDNFNTDGNGALSAYVYGFLST